MFSLFKWARSRLTDRRISENKLSILAFDTQATMQNSATSCILEYFPSCLRHQSANPCRVGQAPVLNSKSSNFSHTVVVMQRVNSDTRVHQLAREKRVARNVGLE